MDDFICKIATRDELNKRWEYLIKDDNLFSKYKEFAFNNFDNNNSVTYIGLLNGEIICEATAYIKEAAFKNDIDNPEGLLTDKMIYLAAFRTDKEFEGKGYFSKLYKYMETDLIKQGYTEFSLGVGPENVRNMEIYFHLGFTHYIKTVIQYENNEEDVIIFYKKII